MVAAVSCLATWANRSLPLFAAATSDSVAGLKLSGSLTGERLRAAASVAPARRREGIMAGSYMGEFLYARDHVVDELHAQGKDDSEIAQTLSMSEDQVLLIRTRSREDDPDL